MVGTALVFRATSARAHNVTKEEFLQYYHPRAGGQLENLGYWHMQSRANAKKLVHGLPSKVGSWKNHFFFVSGTGWEFPTYEHPTRRVKGWWETIEKDQFKDGPIVADTVWMESAENCSLSHYKDMNEPTMLWRYGMGPKPLNYALDVLVEDLEEFNALRSEAILRITEEKGVTGKEIATPKQVEEEEEEVMEAGIDLIPWSRKRPAVETPTATPPPLRIEVSKPGTLSKKKKGRLTSPLAQAAKRQKSTTKPSPPPSSTPFPPRFYKFCLLPRPSY